ncbi:glutamate receptor 3-like [Anneissia japonica]|uniref:glutamate receptor 3-like n=1 Tax=Anneissia japonica TaxID=1529436 RepID=UPI0014256C9F|nr:glutamate receptor 3-like [Anneissia japonica]
MAHAVIQILACLAYFHTNIRLSNGEGVTFGALLGKDTGSPGSVYYEILTHAMSVVRANSTFLTQFHKDVSVVEIDRFTTEDLYPALMHTCEFVENNVLSTLIVTEDVCIDCGDVGGFVSQALPGPIFTIDPGQIGSNSRALKLYPTPEDMSTLLLDMLDYFKWRKWTIVYQDSQHNTFEDIRVYASENKFNITLRAYDGDVPALAEKIKSDNNQNILLMTESEEATLEIIKQGIEHDIFSSKYTWMLAYLDVFIDRSLEEILEKEGVYITRFKMNYTTEWQYTYPSIQINNRESREWSMREKLMFDAFITAAYGLRRYHERKGDSQSLSNIFPGDSVIQPCEETNPNERPLSELFHDMLWYNFEGLTGNIAFDEIGNRVNYSVMVYSGRGRALNQLRGEWVQNPAHWEQRYNLPFESENRFNITRYLKGEDRKLQVVSIEAAPFLFVKTDGEKDATNGRFEGFIMELLEEIKNSIKRIEFNYEVELVPDGKYGRPGKYDNIWSGMVGEVYRGKADIAAGPLTIRADRSAAVAFTYPFMDAGVRAMVQHPNHVKDAVFNIFYPFAAEVWILNGILFFLVTLILYLCNYFSPYEWRAAAERGDVFEENRDNFNATNTMWFLGSTLFLQSYDASPRSNSGRVITIFWWAFVIIMVFLFLSNAPRYLNFSKQLTKIRTVYELVDQLEVQPGFIESSSTFFYFKKSRDNTDNQLYKMLKNANPSGIVDSLGEGVKMIRNSGGKYTLLGEAPILEYEASKEPCDLFVGSGTLVQQSYALAVRKGSPLEEPISHAIQNLRDNGVIHRLELNYWDRHSRCGNLTTWEKQGIYSYTAYDFRGIYALFSIGVIISIFVFLIEYMCCNSNRRTRKTNNQQRPNPTNATHAKHIDYEMKDPKNQEKQWL